MLKAGRLEPSVTGGGAVEEVIRVLTVVVDAGSTTRSKSLSPSPVHLGVKSDRSVNEME